MKNFLHLSGSVDSIVWNLTNLITSLKTYLSEDKEINVEKEKQNI